VEAVVSLLAEDADWSMPPLPAWFSGHEELRGFMQAGPLSGDWRWRHLPARASGQAAVGVYNWDAEQECYLPFALDVLTLEGSRIKEVTAFITRTTELPDRDAFARWPEQPLDPSKVESVFESVGLPGRLDSQPRP
jgi:RNA polymerase sigma-70 factor, ECF subfamily